MILYWHFLWVHIYGNLREGMEEDRGSKKKERKSQTRKKVGGFVKFIFPQFRKNFLCMPYFCHRLTNVSYKLYPHCLLPQNALCLKI